MLRLHEGMLLYHGSYTTVSRVDLSECKAGKDFGRGFYLTTSREQAHRFVLSAVRKHTEVYNRDSELDLRGGSVSVFRVRAASELTTYYFDNADID